MSIINEALRKTQQERVNEPPKNLTLTVYRNALRKKTVGLIAAGILTITALLVMIMLPIHMSANKMQVVLNGVFVSDNVKIAYVNNEMFHLGDSLHGMKIVAINLDAIILQSKKGKMVLRPGYTYLL